MDSDRRGRRGNLAVVAAAVVLAVFGASAVAVGLQQATAGPPPAPPLTAPSATPTPPPPAVPSVVPAPEQPAAAQDLAAKTMPRSRPVALTIPAMGIVDSSLVDLGKEADGTLEVPTDYGQAGWFAPGPAPGQFGPAVIAGHVDSKAGPAIFYRLGELQPGATLSVTREDGSTAEFVVDKVERYPKDAFPTAAVYGDTTQRSELRLITCGGEFDSGTGHYVDNVVAYAHLL
ncbi:MAG: class F sortase [Frankiaceae bacterium]|nr:class F sortase [Frankiaceae bacterium]